MEVTVEVKSHARIIILNRPKQMNALSDSMISRLLQLFLLYEADPVVKVLILKGTGRAFSSGGDVVAVFNDVHTGDWKLGANFFSKEFSLNYLMATYSKPQVSILDGFVMGGGAGASIHGMFRIATENSIFAMPETSLGLFPDVGASYFLSRLPGFLGEYIGLSGAKLDGADMLACGLASHFVPSVKLPMLEDALCDVMSSDPGIISSHIDRFAEKPSLKEGSFYFRMEIINRCFCHRTVEEILKYIENEIFDSDRSWISNLLQMLQKASPTSLKLSLRSIRRGRLENVSQCLTREYRMVCHVLKGEFTKDFFEGCRALLIHKDKNPKWMPNKLEDVPESVIEQYFLRPENEGWDDLRFP